ncbi:MAG TPA: 1-(5-phosphoribosyl)-5-((5-phosphoribosylamino)methylideneamino)imidazole-4-carboxamide isomerase [Gammaproteobacteria bacterium]|nr:1-(5-phosphoribosyl)-5-((5-phosphoribosylamino)methylideneamino)imidazole-4-carboxamide isomerase [Gammaproteobacteria bacterium]
MTDAPRPTELSLHQKSRILEISYADGEHYELSFEFLRVHSPSAEVQGHGPGQGVLQMGKENVMITHVEPVGSYAIQPSFDDGHDTGIYSWETLHDMGKNKEKYWQEYLQKLAIAGHKRKGDSQEP